MTTVYIVQNSGEVIMGVFSNEAQAVEVVKSVGEGIWNEKWTYEEQIVDEIKLNLLGDKLGELGIKVVL